MSWLRKSIYGVIGAVLTGLVSYTVERVKGTPPDQIGAAMWRPFQRTLDWFVAPAQITHGRVLMLTFGSGLAVLLLIREWTTARHRARTVRPGFHPTNVQAITLGQMLNTYGSAQSRSSLHSATWNLTKPLGGEAYLARQLEELVEARLVRGTNFNGVTLYELTTHGRNWVLDQINRQARELDSAPPE
jgi:hypothetical protein